MSFNQDFQTMQLVVTVFYTHLCMWRKHIPKWTQACVYVSSYRGEIPPNSHSC